MGLTFSRQQNKLQMTNQSRMLKKESKILVDIGLKREEIIKLDWDITCENLYYAYLKFKISNAYQHMKRVNIKYIICEFYIFQSTNKVAKKFMGLYETFNQNKDEIQVKIPKQITSGIQFQYVLYFIFPPNHIYQVQSKYITKRKDIIPEIELIEKKDNDLVLQKLLGKVDQIKQSGYQLNLLLAGKIGVGKSTFIRHTLERFEEHFKKKVKNKKPYVCAGNTTATKNWSIYQLEQGIRLIDTPGYGAQVGQLSTQDFIKEYKDIYKIGLAGKLDYDQYQLPNHISIRSNPNLYRQNYQYDKIIHSALIFIDLNETPVQIQLNKQLIEQCNRFQINPLLIVNKIDKLIQYQYSGSTYARILSNLEKTGYKLEHLENIFPVCLLEKQIQESQACKYLYLSLLNKSLDDAYEKVVEYTYHLLYYSGQLSEVVMIWKQQEQNQKLKDILKKYINRKLQLIEIKINDKWTSVTPEIASKNLHNYVSSVTGKKKYIIQLRDNPKL